MYSLSLWLALGALGLILAPTWLPLGCPWVPWGGRDNFSQICQKLDLQFRANVSNEPRLHTKCSLPEFSLDLAEVAYGPQLATPLPRAGGWDDVSSKESPSK